MRKTILPAAAVLALIFHVWAALSFIKSSAPAYDEPLHLLSGYAYWAGGTKSLNVSGHPPLAPAIAALPLIAAGASPDYYVRYTAGMGKYEAANLFLYDNIQDPDKTLNSCRAVSFFVWTGLLAAFILLWAKRLGGPAAACGAAIVYFCNPGFIASNAIIGTDAAAAVFYFAVFFFLRGFKTESGTLNWRNIAAAGACCGFALASKMNLVILPFAAAAMMILQNRAPGRLNVKRIAVSISGLFAIAYFVLAAIYKFNGIGTYFIQLKETFLYVSSNPGTFALGKNYPGGVWWYFIFALFVKTQLALLILAAAGYAALFKTKNPDRLWLAIPPAAYLLLASFSPLQIGYRHILPVLPFLITAAGYGVFALAEKIRFGRPAAGLLLLWLPLSALRAHPHYLAYFNDAAGGPANGYKLLVNSNLDWGQGIKELALKLKQAGNPPVYLCYFGVADPRYYGMRYVPAGVISNVGLYKTGENPALWDRQLIAVSATNLQAAFYADKTIFDWLKSRKPLFTAAYSIFVYDLTGDKAAAAKLAETIERLARLQRDSKSPPLRAEGSIQPAAPAASAAGPETKKP